MKTYINVSLFLLLISSSMSANMPNNNYTPPNRLHKKTNIAPCQRFYGNALVDCMDSLDYEKFLMQLMLLKAEKNQRFLYFQKKLQNPEAYRNFFDQFKTEKDWQNFENSLSNEERKFFPNIHSIEDQDNYVSKLVNYRRLKYVGYGVGGTVLAAGGGYVVYTGYLAILAAIKTAAITKTAAELALAAKATAGAITAKEAVAGGAAVAASAYMNNQNSSNPPRQSA